MATIIVLLFLNLTAIILSAIVLYFKSYTQEKGKNLSTKEDIEEITEKVETIKSEVSLLTQKKSPTNRNGTTLLSTTIISTPRGFNILYTLPS